jgi:methylenetetrahydrofolate--tRNA-(uracil-5-)-methyltransferase
MPERPGANAVVSVVGAGLAGCEAAWQLVRRGIRVKLYEMRPACTTPAHRTAGFAELVCSNSLKAEYVTSASGLLKAEMRALGSLIVEAAEKTRVPAGGALAVDRERFSAYITEALSAHPLCGIAREAVTAVPEPPCVIATGPLTDRAMADAIAQLPGMAPLNFFDAAAPIVTRESLDMDRIFPASRYGRGGDDYLNCPMNEAEYNAFYEALVSAELHEMRDFEKGLLFEGCLPVEALA